MLRLLFVALLLGNAAFFAWTQGMLAPYGFAPAAQSEPQRLKQQLRPDAVRILAPAEMQQLEGGAASVAATATTTLCLQAGLYNEQQANNLRTRLAVVLPAGSWVLENAVEPAHWMIYMGRYPNAEAVAKKRNELRQRGVSFETLTDPALEPGLSLGNFLSQEEAEAEMARIAKRGVKTARVIQSQAELSGQRLKFAVVDASLRSQIDTLLPELLGKALQKCS